MTTKQECESRINGRVCDGCGRPLTAIETVDNAGRPTFWSGCEHCESFRNGVTERHFKISRKIIEEGIVTPYTYMNKCDYDNSPERLEYWLASQTAGLSRYMAHIEAILKDTPE
jgi:hypothetical protein